MYENPSNINLTPDEFELEVKKIIEASRETLESFSVTHKDLIDGVDGEYEIDVAARFSALGGSFLVLIECKRYKSSVKREIVQALNDKVRSIGAQKGMLFTTSGFQSGAVEYAKKHGIALVQLVDGKSTYKTRSLFDDLGPPAWANIPAICGLMIGKGENGCTSISQISIKDAKYLNKFLFE